MLALWGSGVFKAGECVPGFPASRTFPDTENHYKTMSLLTFSKKMELALEFWSLPFRFLMNASANLLVFVAECHGASLGPPGRQMRDTGAHLGGRLAAPGRLQGEDWVDTRPQGRLQGGDLSFGHKHSQISVSRGATGTVRTGILRSFFWA